MKSTTLLSVAGLAATHFGTAFATSDAECPGGKTGVPVPSAMPVPNAAKSHGCYSSGGNLTSVKIKENLSSGACLDACGAKDYYVMGLHGNECLCGFAYPAEDDQVKESSCNYPCPSYPCEACGGLGDDSFYSIWNTGVNIDVPEYKEDEDTSSSSAAASTAVATKTQTETKPAETTDAAAETTSAAPEEEEKKGGANVGAIAGGVVAGVAVIAALVSALFFFMRRKRNAEIEEEHRRNAAVNAFISGSKPPSSSDGISMTDSRLDPVLAHRRMSDGSIADNQDYSRRILRVTNA